jgi:predicted GIY-YIG superfamily endonuclease
VFFVYLVHCADSSYYVGHTEDLDRRIAAHQSGDFRGYTSDRLPVRLVWSEAFESRDDAFRMERQIKGWSRAKKEALIRGDWEEVQRLARSNSSKHPSPDEGPSTSSG